jgi:hypothetical protein
LFGSGDPGPGLFPEEAAASLTRRADLDDDLPARMPFLSVAMGRRGL